jgi:hypothetical protein
MRALVPVARLVFGAWLLASGLNHFTLALWAEPTGTQPLAIELTAIWRTLPTASSWSPEQ